MTGSYLDPRSYANDAIKILEEAYEESQGSHAGSLILKAIEAINYMKEEIKGSSQQRAAIFDPLDFNESNSAV
jgi:hypothetical protein